MNNSKEIDVNSHLSRNMTKMAKLFNLDSNQVNAIIEEQNEDKSLEINSSFGADKIDLNYDQTEEEIKNDMVSMKDDENKSRNQKAGKFGTNIFNLMKNKIKGIGKVLSVSSDVKDKYLVLPKIDEDNNYSSQALSQFWTIFKFVFQKSEKIQKVIIL